MIWSPLAGGRLYNAGDEQARRVWAVLAELAVLHGVSPTTVAYAWILRHPSRPIPITGSRRIHALQEAVAALALTLSAEDWYRIWQASIGYEVP
jgi:predicted oxidoreductase